MAAQLTHIQAEHRVASVKLDLARATFKRRSELVKKNNVSHQLYDEAVYDKKSSEALLAAAEARINEMRATIDQTDLEISLSTIRAPYDGQIVGRLVDEGTTVSAGAPILRIIQAGALEVRAGIPVRAASTLAHGKRYQIEIGGNIIEAPLTAVLEEVDINTRTVPTVFRLTDPTVGRAGQIARIIVKRKVPAQGFWIPITGLVAGRRGLWNAFALDPSGSGDGVFKLSRRELKLIYNTATHAFVTGTVTEGERLVTMGLHKLVAGQLVRVP